MHLHAQSYISMECAAMCVCVCWSSFGEKCCRRNDLKARFNLRKIYYIDKFAVFEVNSKFSIAYLRAHMREQVLQPHTQAPTNVVACVCVCFRALILVIIKFAKLTPSGVRRASRTALCYAKYQFSLSQPADVKPTKTTNRKLTCGTLM